MNSTGYAVSNLSVTHTCDDKIDTISPGDLPIMGVSAVHSLITTRGHKDYWSGSFTMNGKSMSFSNKRVNMPNDPDRVAVIMLRADEYDVFTPDGARSENNGY